MLSTSFCAVPAFRRVDPATTSGPTSGVMAISTARASSESGVQLIPTVTAPMRRASATAPSTYGVRPLAAMPTSTSRGAEPVGRQVADADGRIVFGGFGRAAEGRFAARDDALHHVRRHAEGGRTFRGIQHAQPPAGAGADVEEPSAALEGRDDGIHRARDGGNLALHGGRHLAVLRVDDAQHLFRGQRVDARRCRVGLFGEKIFEHVFSRLAWRNI